jgi:DNA-binding transcriptional regulator LsrR (DeoR family)
MSDRNAKRPASANACLLERLRPVVKAWAGLGFRWADDDVVREIEASLKGYSRGEIARLVKRYIEICQIAQMLASGRSGDKIALELGKSASYVSSRRTMATDLGVLHTMLNRDLIPLAYGVRRDLGEALSEQFGRRITVFHTPARKAGEADGEYWARRIQSLAECAAPMITDRLLRSEKLGVAWGTTLSLLTDSICRQKKWRERTSGLTVVPMAGEMVGSDAHESRSCSALADKIASEVQGDATALSLRGVPPFISTETSEVDANAIRDYFHRLDVVRRVDELSHELDTILTSIGIHEQPNKLYTAELAQTGLTPDALRELSSGDIGGVLLERACVGQAQQERFEQIRRNWLGVPKECYRSCTERAQKTGRPGVLVIALGRNKAEILERCMAESLVSECFIDEDLGQALAARRPDHAACP